jgi:hypothetical protein
MNVDISEELQPIYAALDKIVLRLDELENRSIPEWCTLSQAAGLKNLSYETLKKHPEWGPDPGKAELVCGTRRWHKSVVSEWLLQGDEASEASYRSLIAV